MNLRHKVISGVSWTAVSNILRQILQVISLVIYARYLSADDFGLFAIIMIFITFSSLFSNMGTSSAIVNIDNTSKRMLSSVFFLNIFIGIIIYVILIVSSTFVSDFFNKIELVNLLNIMAINFIIISFSIVQRALLEKELEFKKLSMIETVSIYIAVAVGITFAMNGFGVYSLLIQTITNSISVTMLLWIFSRWRPSFIFSFYEIRKILSFTTNLTSFNIINYFARNADQILIGKFLSSSSLGIYSLAYKIMLYPIQNISATITRVLFPAFSKIQHDNKRFKEAYLHVIFFISLVTFPLMMGLVVLSDLFVSVLFGEKWQQMAVILMILAPIGMIQSIVTTIGTIFLAKANTSLLLKIGTINSIITIISFIVGLPFGIEGVAMSYFFANLIMLYPNLYFAWKQINLNIKEGILKIFPVFLISFMMSILVFISKNFLELFILNKLLLFIILICVGILIYAVFLKIYYKNLSEIFKKLRNRT